jgi:hypothetical protein
MLEQSKGRTFEPRTVADVENKQEEQRQEQIRRNQAVIDLLNTWEQEDPDEQRETVALLMQSLDADRTSSRKLFP